MLVHTDDDPVQVAALGALLTVEPPAGGLRVVVVDCAGDSSEARPWASHLDSLQVVEGSRDFTISGARNLGAEVAATPFVAFLDGRAMPGPTWLRESLQLISTDGSIAGVTPPGSADLSAVSFTGLPGSNTTNSWALTLPTEVLAPAAHAAVFHTGRFQELGGYDPDLGLTPASIDLGWRTWIHGYRILRAPAGAVAAGPVQSRKALDLEHYEKLHRDALCTIFKNYENASLEVALPAALALAAERGAKLDDDHAAAAARAIAGFNRALPDLRPRRDQVQAARRRTDSELLRLFRNPLDVAAGDDGISEAYDWVIEAFSLKERFGSRRRVLVATPDVLTSRMAGPAIRAWQISSALSVEHDVVLVTTTKVCDIGSTDFGVESADDDRLRELERWADVIVLQGFVLEGRPFLRDTNKVMVVDIYDPLHLEQLELERDAEDWRRRHTVRNATAVLNEQLVRGDYFICATPKQRDFWLGQMSALGRINPLTYDQDETLEALLGIVPFGLPDHPPVHTAKSLKGVVPGIAPSDEVILWGGGIYNWFDPLTLIHAVARLRCRRPQVRLFFMGMRHPNPEVAEMRMASAARQLADELGLTGTHVFFNEDWIAYDDRQNFLLEADVGVSTHLDHVETAFSFRTRILDYIWAGLPIVATSGDAFAEMIEAERLGFTVPAGDVAALEAALFRLLDDRESASLCRKQLEAVRPRFAWSLVLEPLLAFCRTARRAPDLVDPEMAAHLCLPPRRAEPDASPLSGRVAIPVAALKHLRAGGPRRLLGVIVRRLLGSLHGR